MKTLLAIKQDLHHLEQLTVVKFKALDAEAATRDEFSIP